MSEGESGSEDECADEVELGEEEVRVMMWI